MPKSLVLGNGNMLIGFDRHGQVKDWYFPFVGLENQISSEVENVHKIGVWVDGAIHWFDGPSWDISIDCANETLAGIVRAESALLGLTIHFDDVVYNEKNIFIRRITVLNQRNAQRDIKLFFHAGFELYGSHRGETAYYDPTENVLVHYEGKRVFLINMRMGELGFDDYSIGLYHLGGKEGTYRDAEDGVLSKNPIEHGKIDSTIGFSLSLDPQGAKNLDYWVTVAETHEEVYRLNQYVKVRTPEHLSKTTHDFWRAWTNKQSFSFYGLPDDVVSLFKKSLVYIRAHADNNGSIIASADSDMLQYGLDTYSYMWPRDGAVSALALARAGDANVARRFFEFSNDVITDSGYFMHKYRTDKTWGSSWHPWIRDGKPALPIQEDETALVLEALWHYYDLTRDLEFIEDLYNPLIFKAARFMIAHHDERSGLPLPSYDLWEENYAISTFTASAVYGALIAAGKFANLLGKKAHERDFNKAAEALKEAILNSLYSEERKMFYKMIKIRGNEYVPDSILDMSSIYSIYRFGVLNPSDPRVADSIKTVEEKLVCKTAVGGVPRYENDAYYRLGASSPNPWFVTTLWLAQYYTMRAEKENDLAETKRLLSWATSHALPSGVLSEQLNPYTGEQLSAAPLTWSHSEFVLTVILYLEKLEELGICKACYPMR